MKNKNTIPQRNNWPSSSKELNVLFWAYCDLLHAEEIVDWLGRKLLALSHSKAVKIITNKHKRERI